MRESKEGGWDFDGEKCEGGMKFDWKLIIYLRVGRKSRIEGKG